jgi:hypothetical protein
MAVAGVLPYRLESAVHISDLHATLFGLASAPGAKKIVDDEGLDSSARPIIDGVDLWESIVPHNERALATDHDSKVSMIMSGCHALLY